MAAARAGRLSEDAQTILIEPGPDVLFAHCGMPYFIGEIITDHNKLRVVAPERLETRLKLDIRVCPSVESIDRVAPLDR